MYQSFADLVSLEAAGRPLDHGPRDLAIDVELGKTLLFVPSYNLSLVKLKCLKEYLAERVPIGTVRRSISLAGALILFIKKANSTLRLCIDY